MEILLWVIAVGVLLPLPVKLVASRELYEATSYGVAFVWAAIHGIAVAWLLLGAVMTLLAVMVLIFPSL